MTKVEELKREIKSFEYQKSDLEYRLGKLKRSNKKCISSLEDSLNFLEGLLDDAKCKLENELSKK